MLRSFFRPGFESPDTRDRIATNPETRGPSYVALLPVAISAMLVCALGATPRAASSSSSPHFLARVDEHEPLDPAMRLGQAGPATRLPPAAQQQNSPNPVPKGALSSDPTSAGEPKPGSARPGAAVIHGWALTWSDEFNGPNGSAPDPTKWKFDVGGDGWGNRELEYYTSRAKNAFVENGHLVIRAYREDFTGADGVTRHYTSARLKTQGVFAQAYGRFEARIKIPGGQGIWPAFWLLGDDLDKVPWPGSGEIDVMENIGREPQLIHGSMHGPGYSSNEGLTAPFELPGELAFSDEYHIYAIEWEPNVVRFFVDSTNYATFTPANLAPELRWVFDHPFFILLNVAIGGEWGGSPDESTRFPQEMLVDFVRVYRKTAPATVEK